jgi:hypothetical protein
MNKVLLIIGFLIMLSSCRPVQHIATTSKDSIRIERVTEYRDTMIQVPADSSWLQALIECDSNGQAYLRQIENYQVSGRSTLPRVSLQNNQLQVNCRCDSAAIYAKYSRIYDRSSQSSTVKETVTIEVNRLTWWQKTQVYGFRVLTLIIAAYFIIKRFLI